MVSEIMTILSELLPEGAKRGNEYEIGSVGGEPGRSLKVRVEGMKTGVWKDFSTDQGGDLIDLWCECRGVQFVDALKEIKDFLSIDDDEPKIFRKKKYVKPDKPKFKDPNESLYKWFGTRAISKETVDRLKIKQKGDAILFPYLSPDGELELAKWRGMSEKKFWSNENPIPCLFGWQSIPDNAREVTLVEGEIDQLSYAERGIPSLSLPKGGGAGGKQDWIEYEFHRLDRFEWINVSMDSDGPGQEAKREIIDRLGRHRCKVVDLRGCKDANEAHMSGLDLARFVESASTEDPDELKRLVEFHGEIISELNGEVKGGAGLLLPWEKTRQEFKLRPGETTVWAGINGHGKSLALSHVIVDGIANGARWCVASMEMPPRQFGDKLYRQIGWTKDCAIESNIKDFASELFIFNEYGVTKASKILEVFKYAKKRYGIDHFVIDSLTKCGFSEDDYSGQKAYVDEIVEFGMKYNVHMHLVVHVRKSDDEHRRPGKFDIKGSGGVSDVVNNVLTVWRNKKKEKVLKEEEEINNAEERERLISGPDMVLSCEKQKKTGVEGSYGLWFHHGTCQFLERQDSEPKQYIYA
jgi:twinkle protein